MKRLSIVWCAFALTAMLGVPSALAAGYSHGPVPPRLPMSLGPLHQGYEPMTANGLRGVAGFRPLGGPAGAVRATVLGGGTTIGSASELTYPTPSGSVDSATRPDDLYWFYLDAGAEMDFLLTPSTPGSQIALKVYDRIPAPDLSSLDPLVSNTSYDYTHPTGFVAPYNGYFLLDVHATTGSSAYTIPYDWYFGPNDDIVPTDGQLAPMISASPVSDWLDADWDVDDVYRLPLRAGDKVSLNLTARYDDARASSGTDLDLFLLDPSGKSVWPHSSSNTAIVAHSMNPGSALDYITSYTALKTGNYYVDVACAEGYAPSYLQWSVNPIRPSISRAPSAAKLAYKRKKGAAVFTLGGRFTNQFALPINGVYVYLQTSTNAKKWKNKLRLTTNANGAVAAKITAKKKGTTYFRWYRPAAWNGKAAYSAAQKVTIK